MTSAVQSDLMCTRVALQITRIGSANLKTNELSPILCGIGTTVLQCAVVTQVVSNLLRKDIYVHVHVHSHV